MWPRHSFHHHIQWPCLPVCQRKNWLCWTYWETSLDLYRLMQPNADKKKTVPKITAGTSKSVWSFHVGLWKGICLVFLSHTYTSQQKHKSRYKAHWWLNFQFSMKTFLLVFRLAQIVKNTAFPSSMLEIQLHFGILLSHFSDLFSICFTQLPRGNHTACIKVSPHPASKCLCELWLSCEIVNMNLELPHSGPFLFP